MPTTSGRRKIRLFLEGREVPVVSAQIISKANMPSMCLIEMVPLQIIKFIKPRTQVHVLVRDSFTFGDDNFYLAFEGETLGRTMIKRHDQRGFRITAYDYTNYWDDAKAYVMNPNYLVGKVAPQVAFGEPPPASVAKAAGGVLFQTSATSNTKMIDILRSKKGADGKIDLVAGIAEVIKKLATVNEFYRTAYERLRIIDRILIYSSGRLGQFLYRLKVEEFLTSFTGMNGGFVSLRQMLMSIMAMIFHDQISLPFPSLVKTTRDKETGMTIGQFLFIPDTYSLPPPKCNVIFPNQQISFQFDEDFRAAPTRYGFRASFPLTSGDETIEPTYPIQYYPNPFSDYMTRGKLSSDSDLKSAMGPSTLIKDSKGRSYASLYYGQKAEGNSVGTAYGLVMREQDYQSNEESLRGIYYETDVLAPAYSALVRTGNVTTQPDGTTVTEEGVSTQSRNEFMREVGAYLFFKKRYGARNCSAEIMFNPYLVPGFNVVFLDDSEAGQSFVAKLQGITQNLTHEGFATSVELGYGRDFDEIDFMSGGAGDPPLPKWFDPAVFGVTDENNKYFIEETNFLYPADPPSNTKSPAKKPSTPRVKYISREEKDYRDKGVKNPTVYPNLSQFYQKVLACDSITEYGPAPQKKGDVRTALVTTRGAISWLVYEYINKSTQEARDEFARAYVRRPLVPMLQAFRFLGAVPAGSNPADQNPPVPEENALFVADTSSKNPLPGRFDGKGYSDETILQVRRAPIDIYIAALKSKRGFRG